MHHVNCVRSWHVVLTAEHVHWKHKVKVMFSRGNERRNQFNLQAWSVSVNVIFLFIS